MAAPCGVCLLLLHMLLQSNARLINMFRTSQRYNQYETLFAEDEQFAPQIWHRDLPPDWRDKFTTSEKNTISCLPDALKLMSVVSDKKATKLSTKLCQGPENVPGVLAQLYKNNVFALKSVAKLAKFTNPQMIMTSKTLDVLHSKLPPSSMTVLGYLSGTASDPTKPHFVIWASDVDLEPHL